MTELDLGLKVGIRRLFWQMGYTTRLDVELRGSRPPVKRGSGENGYVAASAESFTDLDVLGVSVGASLTVHTTIADCKSGRRDKPTARMFWVRGVADLFGADDLMLVREHDVNDATRQLSNRLGITVVAAADLQALQKLHGAEPPTGVDPLDVLFDRELVSAHLAAFNNLDRNLDPLLEYRDFDYWVYDQHRNIIQLVAHLQQAKTHLDARNPVHLALFMDLAWLYVLAAIRAAAHIRAAFLQDPDRGLQEYMFGGTISLREKKEMAEVFSKLAPNGVSPRSHLPEYYPRLRELILRLLRRPAQLQEALRYAELTSALMFARRKKTLIDVLEDQFDPLAAKLLADVCGFLVEASGLNPNFRVQARAWLLAEMPDADQKLGVDDTTSTSDQHTSLPNPVEPQKPRIIDKSVPRVTGSFLDSQGSPKLVELDVPDDGV